VNAAASFATDMGKPTTSPEARVLAAAFKGRPHGFLSKVARQVGVEPKNLSHWIHGRRPVPPVYARPLAEALGLEDPGQISVTFAAIADGEPANVLAMPGEPRMSPELIDSRDTNNVKALRYIVSAMVTTMLTHRPAEASDFARVLRAHAPPKFHNQGYLGELLAIAESRGAPKVKEPAASRPRSRVRS
jgi:hypothetical protein